MKHNSRYFAKMVATTAVFFIVLFPFRALASESLDAAISGTVLSIVEKLTHAQKLHGRKIAVLGFCDGATDDGCKDLSLLLANRIVTELDRFRSISKADYQIMTRHNLEAMETEFLIAQKNGIADFDVVTDLLGKSDILITGTWQDSGRDTFELTVKALEFAAGEAEAGARVMASVSKTIDKSGLPGPALACLENQGEKVKKETVFNAGPEQETNAFQINYVYRPGGVGRLKPVRHNEILQSGDHYKIIFTPDEDCYVYIFQVDSSGQIYQLFPMGSFGGVPVNNYNPVKAGGNYILPAPDKAFVLDRQVGAERFYLVFSKTENDELAGLYDELTAARDARDSLREATAREKLDRLFKTRGPAKVVADRPARIAWEDDADVFDVVGQALATLCDDCVHVLEFIHQ